MSKKSLYTLPFIFLFAVSCKKYEDGPSMSLRSKKARLAGEWSVEKVTSDGTDITSDYMTAVGSDFKLHINKDGDYHVHGTFEDQGTWEFKEGKEEVTFQSSAAGSEAEEYIIRKLKNNELWLEHHHDDEVLEFHYKQ